MKVAVCISGALRGNLATLSNIHNNIILPLKADVFIHTWDSYYVWPGICGDNNIVYRLFGPEAQNLLPVEYRNRLSFEKIFPHTFAALKDEQIESISLDAIKSYITWQSFEISNEKDFLEKIAQKIDCRNNSVNQLKMFFSMYKSYNLMKTYEYCNNITYDYVIRIRPDITINQIIDEQFINSINNNEIAVELYEYGPTDQFFIATNKTMGIIVGLWEKILSCKNLSPFKNYKNVRSHYLLFLWIIKNNIIIKNMKLNRHIYAATKNSIPDIRSEIEKDLKINAHIKDEIYNFCIYLIDKCSFDFKRKFDIKNTYKLISNMKDVLSQYEKMRTNGIFLSQYISYVREFDSQVYDLLRNGFKDIPGKDETETFAIQLAYENPSDYASDNYKKVFNILNKLSPSEVARLFRSIPYHTNKTLLRDFYLFLQNHFDFLKGFSSKAYFTLIIMAYSFMDYDSFKKFISKFIYSIELDDKNIKNLLYTWQHSQSIDVYSTSKIPKVAICISGQLRGFEFCVPSWKNAGLFDNCEYDIYCDVWNSIGNRKLELNVPSSYVRVFKNINFAKKFMEISTKLKINKEYPNLLRAINCDIPIDIKYIEKIFNKNNLVNYNICIENETDFNHLSNQHKMLYKIEHCFNRLEKKSYDLIVRIRPDAEILGKINYKEILLNLKPAEVFSHLPMTRRKNIECPDQFFIGRYNEMSKVSQAYSGILENIKIKRPFFPIQIFAHTSLAYYLFYSCIFVEKLKSLDKIVLCEFNKTINDIIIKDMIIKDISQRSKTSYDNDLLNILSY